METQKDRKLQKDSHDERSTKGTAEEQAYSKDNRAVPPSEVEHTEKYSQKHAKENKTYKKDENDETK